MRWRACNITYVAECSPRGCVLQFFVAWRTIPAIMHASPPCALIYLTLFTHPAAPGHINSYNNYSFSAFLLDLFSGNA